MPTTEVFSPYVVLAGPPIIAALPDERSILQVAIGFEEDSITFYEMIGGFVEDVETLRHLNSIIEEEKRHITILEERIGMLPG